MNINYMILASLKHYSSGTLSFFFQFTRKTFYIPIQKLPCSGRTVQRQGKRYLCETKEQFDKVYMHTCQLLRLINLRQNI